jgi:hypothetical protein
MAYMARMAGDMAYAHEMFTRIGQGWDEVLWHTKKNFQMVQQWAQFAEVPKMIDAAMKAADDNLQTSDGRKFDEQVAKTFASNYSAIVSECLKSSGDLSPVPFDMVLQVEGTEPWSKLWCRRCRVQAPALPPNWMADCFPLRPRRTIGSRSTCRYGSRLDKCCAEYNFELGDANAFPALVKNRARVATGPVGVLLCFSASVHKHPVHLAAN